MKNGRRRQMIAIALLAILALMLVGCKDSNGKAGGLRGGDMLRYALCIQENKSNIVSCPVILQEKPETISFKDFTAEEKELLSLTADAIDMNECLEYEGYYVYFAILNIACTEYEKAVNVNIDKLFFDVDGETLEYETRHFNIKNTTYFTQRENASIENGNIKISGDFSGLYGHVPSDERKTDLTISSGKDVTVKAYFLTDYLDIVGLEAEGEELDGSKLDLEIKSGDDLCFNYAIALREGVEEDNIIRSSQIVVYESEGKTYLWVYTPGVYIWKDYMDYGNIQRYIDKL